MKKLHIVMAAMLFLGVILMGCGNSNQFGGSFDIDRICFSNEGTKDCTESNPEVSIALRDELEVFLTLTNRMNPAGETGPTVRVYRVKFEFEGPGGVVIPPRYEQLAVDVDPGETVDQAVTVFSMDQINYIAERSGEFDFPFQVNSKVTVWYDTTTAIKGNVERLYSFLVIS